MGFVASTEVEPLDYSFKPHLDLEGTLVEPSTKAVEAFQAEVIKAVSESGLDPAKIKDVGLEDIAGLMVKANDVSNKMVAAACHLTGLTRGQVGALPWRVQQAFVGWIMGLFFNPEA